MTVWLRQVVGVLLALVLCGLAASAHAQVSVPLTMTSTTGLTTSSLDGWTVAFAPLDTGSCLMEVENPSTLTNSVAANCNGVTMTEAIVGDQLALTFVNSTGSLPLETAVGSSATACSGSACSSNYGDIYLDFTVTAPSGVTVSSAQLGLTGSATLSNGSSDLVSTDLSKITGGISSTSFTSASTSASASPAEVSAAFTTAVNSFTISADLKVNGNGATSGSTLTFNSAEIVLTPPALAPEPISLSLFGVGVAGLAVARRRRRR